MLEEKSIFFPIVFHFHQPEGNHNFVLEDCFQKSYGPLVDNIYEFPDVKVTLHFSGNLLEWFIENKPEFIMKLKEMAKRGQIEIIGGGYYEPIFAIIPNRDKIAQMKKLSDFIKKEFGLIVKGAWLSERVWEPNYPSFLNKVGLKYVIVDDNHFRSCGLTQEDTLYSYITEDEGKTLRVFPINEAIRYFTPWKPTYMTVDYLKSIADEEGDRIALFISDAEKMGVWASTYQICYVDGQGHDEGDNKKPFIPSFLAQIANNDWIKSITLSEYMEKFPARGLVYLPAASYDKMEEWVLPTELQKKFKVIRKNLKDDPEKQDEYQFLKGGFWRSFLIKYPESNNMHKKMIYVREKLIKIEEQIIRIQDKTLGAKIEEKILDTWDEIYKAQCNDCYWHGMFGGVYLHFLRFSVYTHLINAEKLIDEMNALIFSNKNTYISITPVDFNMDSKTDIIIESNVLNAYINPSEGGTLFELDYKPKSYNLLNTLTRWYEAYHDKEKFEKEDVMIDKYRRSMFRLRFFHDDVSLNQLHSDDYYEFGDFINGEFKFIKNEKEDQTVIIEMQKEGSIKVTDTDDRIPCVINKKILIEKNKVLLEIKGNFNTENREALERIIENIYIGVDVPFFFNGDPEKFSWSSNDLICETKEEKDLLEPIYYIGSDFQAYDETYDLKFGMMMSSNTGNIKIHKFPIFAYAYTDEGYKKIYQGITVLARFKLKKSFEIELQLKIN